MSAHTLRRILCVEDEADVREIIDISLQAIGGFKVRICSSGEEALACAAAFSPDLILLDVMMPKMDGPATLAELRKIESLAATPVIFITAKAQAAEVKRYRSLGAVDVIAKPFKALELPDRLREIWRGVARQ